MPKSSAAVILSLVTLSASALAADPKPNGTAEHILVVVWDGMRPDFITPQYCPNLYNLAQDGTFFRHHHPSYISTTEVNGAAISTGATPGKNGIQANADYRQELNFMSTYATEGIDAIRRGDLLTGGHYITSPTLAETLQAAGIRTVIAGSKPVGLFQDRTYQKTTEAGKKSVTLYAGRTIPRDLVDSLNKVNDDKGFPGTITIPNKEQDQWTTKALTKGLWKDGLPKYTLLWLSDPDKSQHDSSVGSPNALAGIESSDNNLGEVIKVLKDKKVFDKTDIFVVSDHGFSTVGSGPDIPAILKRQGFKGGSKLDDPEPGDVLTLSLGGSTMFYVMDRDEAIIKRLVDFLQTADFTGVIFSRKQLEGTFPLESVGYSSASPHSPDVIVSLRWSAERNDFGAPGVLVSSAPRKNGTHGSLSHYDMNNILVAGGPDIKKGLINDVPSGNIDLAPTILWLLGVPQTNPMDGRVLHEALVPSKEAAPKVNVKKLDATRTVGLFHWKQYLQVSEVNGTRYFDEGNGEAALK